MEADDTRGGICSFTHGLQFMFFNKMRNKPVIDLNILERTENWDSCIIDATLEFRALDAHCARVQLNRAQAHVFERVQAPFSDQTSQTNWTPEVKRAWPRYGISQ